MRTSSPANESVNWSPAVLLELMTLHNQDSIPGNTPKLTQIYKYAHPSITDFAIPGVEFRLGRRRRILGGRPPITEITAASETLDKRAYRNT